MRPGGAERDPLAMPSAHQRTFVVESYVPGIDEAITADLSARWRAAVDGLRAEGRELAWLRSYAVLEEDTYAALVHASRVSDVVLASERAGIPADHVAELLAVEPGVTEGGPR
jgi:methenyltetrahydromethanopterin cyclohydrolase